MEGIPAEVAHHNPPMDSEQYEIELLDDETKILTENNHREYFEAGGPRGPPSDDDG